MRSSYPTPRARESRSYPSFRFAGHPRRVRILVGDDEPAVRDAVDRALRLEGYETELAADGAEALDALAGRAPDALVLDVLMPRVDGLEVCRRLRAAGDRTPVLVLTARDAVPDRVRGLDAGADDYLVKPFALEELLARLRALLRRTADRAARAPGCLRPARERGSPARARQRGAAARRSGRGAGGRRRPARRV